MKPDHRVLLCCGIAWFCCAIVVCHEDFLDANGNEFKEGNDIIEATDILRKMYEDLGVKSYSGLMVEPGDSKEPENPEEPEEPEEPVEVITIEKCKEEVPQCIETYGHCKKKIEGDNQDEKGKAEESDLECDCPAKTQYDAKKGCQVPDEECEKEILQCTETGGHCKVKSISALKETELECGCPEKSSFDTEEGCHVTENMCEDHFANCKDTGGQCKVEVGQDGADSTVQCICSGTNVYAKGKGCQVSDDDCNKDYPECTNTGGKCYGKVVTQDNPIATECICPGKSLYEQAKGCTVSEIDCQTEFPNCKDTGGECNVKVGKDGKKSVLQCKCSGTNEYAKGKGCQVSDELCTKEIPKCTETGGKCYGKVATENDQSTTQCVCPGKSVHEADKGCTVPDEDCKTDFPNCLDTGGKCNVKVGERDQESIVQCECPVARVYETDKGCKVSDELCKTEIPKCTETGGKCYGKVATENDQSTTQCVCPGKSVYEAGKGCTVPDDDCKTDFPKCLDTGGKCNVKVGEGDQESIVQCECPGRSLYIADEGCIVPVEVCKTDFPKCTETSGKCNVKVGNEKESSEVQCECPKLKGYKKDVGCEDCKCGVNSTGCSFVGDSKTCACVKNSVQKEDQCVDCKCGNNSTGCEFTAEGKKVCKCIEKFAQKGDVCTDCMCGDNSAGCNFATDGKKTCKCTKNFAQKVDVCTACNCGKFANGCSFVGDKLTCDCKKNYSQNVDKCEKCYCGEHSTSCRFDKSEQKCDCVDAFVDINGFCLAEECEEECGYDKDVTCKHDENGTLCLCDEGKEFDTNIKKCRTPCYDDTSCKHGAKCVENDDYKFCKCLQGTSSDDCGVIDDCESGKYKECVGSKGTCLYNTTEMKAQCNCAAKKELKDLSGYCDDCDCGEFSDKCFFKADNKTCSCKTNYTEKDGTCEECYCGKNSTSCKFVKGQKTCECKEGFSEKNGMCEVCDCGVDSSKCSFDVNGLKKCECDEDYSEKNGICEECKCGEDSDKCSFEGENKICKCKKGFEDNEGHCQACNCGNSSISCTFEKGLKVCACKPGTAQNDGQCEECVCGKNTKKCRFEEGEKICKCKDKYAEKNGICTACRCGDQSTGCRFEKETVICECNLGFGSKDGKCVVDNCYDKCGVIDGKEHEEVECKGDRFGTVECVCIDDDRRFDTDLKKCRETCKDEKECKNGAKCSLRDGNKFCICLNGTAGHKCETITECESGGTLEKCKGDKGNCTYIVTNKKPFCDCPEKKVFDNKEGYCQKECKEEKECNKGQICTENKYCSCEDGKTGENCETLKGCTEELIKTCEEAEAMCVYDKDKENNFATCGCINEDFVYDKEEKKCNAKFCTNIGCNNGAKCEFDTANKIGYCECSAGKYYDYSNEKCLGPDKCLLKKTPCLENEVCEKGECACKDPFVKEDDKCIRNFCDAESCMKGANCSESDGSCKCVEGKFYTGSECLETKCIMGDFEQNCDCPKQWRRNATTKKCVPISGKPCDKKCGLGYCADDKCTCVGDLTKDVNGTCVLDPEKVCASGKFTADLSKCDCTGRYKQAEDGITCQLITCSDDIAKIHCQLMGAECKMQWTGESQGYFCQCPPGYVADKVKGICTDACSSLKNIQYCRNRGKVCYNAYSAESDLPFTCDCPPPFVLKDGSCQELSKNVYLLTGIPVVKEKYEMKNGIDYVRLNNDLVKSLEQMFGKDTFDSGYLNDYDVGEKVIKSSAWVRFKKEPGYELKRILFQAQSFPNGTCDDCDTDLYVWPPSLVLSKAEAGKVNYKNVSICSDALKDRLCGKDAMCEDNKCYCPRGYRALDFTIQEIGDATILRCEATKDDLNECVLGTHECSKNTTCVKIPGSYICNCKPGYQKNTENDQNDCFDLCSTNPCEKGSCSVKKNRVNCKCPTGYSGSYCDESDVAYASARKSTVIVGAVLGTILIVATLAFLFYIIKKRKGSYSEDFMPAPRVDRAAEMTERRAMRGGVVNASYE